VKYATDERSLAATTEVEVFTGGGPGGQHRNKTQNAVRLHHRPSGLVVTATERRSLEANKKAAFERLVERLERLNYVPRPRKKTRPKKGAVEARLREKRQVSRKKSDRRHLDD
jgi:protein subunit release factor B